jgi:hypothetical protein
MTARFNRAWARASRANLAASVGLLLTRSASRSASAKRVTPVQCRASTPKVYRFCAGKIPNFRAITRLLRRPKAGLRAAVYEP